MRKGKFRIFCVMVIFLYAMSGISFGTTKVEIADVEGASINKSDPQIIHNIEDSLIDVQRWILALATPAAIIGIGTGVFMKKFSFGDEERIIIGKKLIRNSLISYAFIVGSGLILQALRLLIGANK